MDKFQFCKSLYNHIKDYKYGIPVDGKLQNGSAEWWEKHYHLLSPEEFEKYKGGVCWDCVEYMRSKFQEQGIDTEQYYIITDTPPNYDTHTFIVVPDNDEYIYIEQSFEKISHMIGGVKRFSSIQEIVDMITTTMFQFNNNDRFDSFKYDVLLFKDHPPYGSTCAEYMDWMQKHGEYTIQSTAYNPHKKKEGVNMEHYIEESFQDSRNGVNSHSKKLFFHISTDKDLDDKPLKPRVPTWIKEVKDPEKVMKETGRYEDITTPRVCFSPSIEGCLNATFNMTKLIDENLPGKQLYVYIPEKPISEYKIKSNKDICKDGDVFDANVTGEMWILESVKLKFYGSIKIDSIKDNGKSYNVTTAKTKEEKKDLNNKIGKYIYKWHWQIHPSVIKQKEKWDKIDAEWKENQDKKGGDKMNIQESFSDFLEDEYCKINNTVQPIENFIRMHNYDEKNHTIADSNGIVVNVGKVNRRGINRALREQGYDSETDTIKTDIADPSSDNPYRTKFSVNNAFPYFE